MGRPILDCHHHFFDGYPPEQWRADCGDLNILATVHVEATEPDDGPKEVATIEKMIADGRCKVAAIVASCDLAKADAAEKLKEIMAASPRVRGIRWIIDFDGEATHPHVTRRGVPDCLRDPEHAPKFEAGFGLLAGLGLSYDLQCAPAQLPAAVELFKRHPEVQVVIDHMGKPRALKADGSESDAAELKRWREGMLAMAALPQVHVKLSMLGYAVPGWAADAAKEKFLKGLVLEVIGMFGARRCMFNSNWWTDGASSNSDGLCSVDISMSETFARFEAWVAELPEAEQHELFVGSAQRFYRLNETQLEEARRGLKRPRSAELEPAPASDS